MKQGTASVLCGCHSPIHSLLVLLAWHKWHRRWPAPWQIVCIFLHDIGHWGKDYLDDYEQKKKHGELGARVATRLFGQKGFDLIAGHNSYDDRPKSELYTPDKYSWVMAPTWWLILNTWVEPKLKRKGNSRRESALMFKQAAKENMEAGFPELTHEIYLRQWERY